MLFEQALEVLSGIEHNETTNTIEWHYAELLSARGDYARAVTHYRATAQRWRARRRPCKSDGPESAVGVGLKPAPTSEPGGSD
jgi:hypothetical protein